jgi:hypothetical protein
MGYWNTGAEAPAYPLSAPPERETGGCRKMPNSSPGVALAILNRAFAASPWPASVWRRRHQVSQLYLLFRIAVNLSWMATIEETMYQRKRCTGDREALIALVGSLPQDQKLASAEQGQPGH